MASAGQTEAYVSWNQPVGTAFSAITATAAISSSNGLTASANVYITNAVGPGATAANIIAGPVTISTASFAASSVAIPFAGTVNLPQGATYFLVFQAATANFQLNFANPATETLSAIPTVTSNNDGLAGPPSTTPAYNASFSAAGSPAKGILVSITGNPPANLSITKSGPASAIAGNTIVYTTTVTNNGPGDATGTSVADPTPANLTFVSNTGGCLTAFPCSLGTIASGGSATITSTYTISPAFTGSISNTATVSTTAFDLVSGNNSSTSSATITASTDLSISKTGPATALPGATVVYTVTVTNNGPSTATGVVVADPTPSGLTFVSNSGGCTTAYPCAVGTLVPSGTSTITSTYTVNSAFTGTVSNTATVSSTTTDPTPGNNSSTASTTVTASADVSITKSGPASATPGTNITYTVTVTNNGPSTATSVSVADLTPSGLTFVSNTGACTTAFPCSLGSMTSGQTSTITSTYTVSAAFTGTISNTATVSSAVSDPTPANNSSTASTSVGATAEVSIVKSGASTVAPNADVIYTLTVSNGGPSSAANVSVTDVLPSGVTFVSATPSQGSCSGTTTVTCALGTVAGSGTATVTLTVHTASGLAQGTVISNTASVTTSAVDPNPANNSSTKTVTINVTAIPTLSTGGLALLGLLLAVAATISYRRERRFS